MDRPDEIDSELDRIKEQYESDWKDLAAKFSQLQGELGRLSVIYEECRNLWSAGEFESVTKILDEEGFRLIGDVGTRLSGLKGESDLVEQRLEKIQNDMLSGITCPRCAGLGTVILDKRYERAGGGIVPVVKYAECVLCHGHGKIVLNRQKTV